MNSLQDSVPGENLASQGLGNPDAASTHQHVGVTSDDVGAMSAREMKQFHALREQAGFLIDPMTAEVDSWWQALGDPYCLRPYPEEACIGREFFVRAPGSDEWVWFGHLPDATLAALRKRLAGRTALFPEDPAGAARSLAPMEASL
jgi:hypothetical protein